MSNSGIDITAPRKFPMRPGVLFLPFALLGGLAVASSALAKTPADSARNWGLLGSWKIDCAAPASRDNGDLAYVVRDGALFHERDFGDYQDINRVLSAKVIRGGAIDLVVDFGGLHQAREFVFSKGRGGRARTISNRDVDSGEYSIINGKFMGTGRKMPWLTHCR